MTLLLFDNLEFLTTGPRRIFNLSRRRWKRRGRDNSTNVIEMNANLLVRVGRFIPRRDACVF